MATTLLPFRDYDEHDVINLFTADSTITLPLTKGHIVMIDGGWLNNDELQFLGDVGTSSFDGGVVSERYGVKADFKKASGTSAPVLGMTLYDVKETDENGEKLIFNPRKAAEMEVALSGQAVPVATRGVFLYSGDTSAYSSVSAGDSLYHDDAGLVTTTSTNAKVGKALGATGEGGHILIKLEL